MPLNLAPSLERRFFNFWVSGTLAQISPKRAKISGKRAKTAENVRKIAKSV
jgi:hypothetical protein